MNVFFKKAKCDQCHEGMNFTTKNTTTSASDDKAESGSGPLCGYEERRRLGAFKTPTCATWPGPRLHARRRLKTLEDVVEYYNKGGDPAKPGRKNEAVASK